MAIASLAARVITRCPMPLSPSTSAVAGADFVTVMLGWALKPRAFSRRTYCGRRRMPWPSAPVRSASVISSAQRAASAAGKPAATNESVSSEVTARAGTRIMPSSAIDSSQTFLAQYLRRVTAENNVAVGRGDVGRTNLPHAFSGAHVVRIVAAEEHPIGADRGNEKFQRRLGVQNRVVEEAVEIWRRRMLHMHFRLRPHLPVMHPTAALIRDEAAAVRHDEIQLRVSLQHAAKDQEGAGDAGGERIAEQIAEIIGAQPVGAGDIAGMDHHEGVELFGRRPQRLKARIVEILAADVGANHGAVQAELAHGPAQF